MNKEERENRILEEFHCLIGRMEFFSAFRDGWLSGYRQAKEDENRQSISKKDKYVPN